MPVPAVLLAVALSALAAAGPADAAPSFELETASGEVHTGGVAEMRGGWVVAIAGHKAVPGNEVIALKRKGLAAPPAPAGPCLEFTNGDRLAGLPLSSDGRNVRVQPAATRPADGPLGVPLNRVAVVWMKAPPGQLSDADALYGLLHDKRPRDVLLMRNGDSLVGDLVGFDARQTSFQVPDPRQVPTEKIAALALNTELARNRPPRGTFAHVVLTDGSRLTLVSATADAEALSGQLEFQVPVRVAWERVVALRLVQGRAVYLSDLKPKTYQFMPFLGESVPWARDRNVAGRPMSLRTADGVSFFDKGVGTHSRCELVYSLAGKYRRFETLVGLDQELGKKGSAAVRLLLDNKEQEVPALRRLTHAGPAARVQLDVTGAQELKIEVQWGEGGHVGDVVNLADARLIMAP